MFVGLLSPHAHSDLVEQCRPFFYVMNHFYLIEPHIYHYACEVDTFSRARLIGRLVILLNSIHCTRWLLDAWKHKSWWIFLSKNALIHYISYSQSYVLSLFWVVAFWSLNQFMVILCFEVWSVFFSLSRSCYVVSALVWQYLAFWIVWLFSCIHTFYYTIKTFLDVNNKRK